MKRLLLSAAVVVVFASPAYGQIHSKPNTPCQPVIHDDLLICPNSDEIIAIAQRIGTREQDEISSPVSLISETEIVARDNAYIADLLRTIPGASINRSGPGGSLTQLRLRGSEANHILVLVDGVEVSNPNTGEFDFGSLRSEDVVRIEVLRGEQSALWGSDAIGGVVNIITRAGDDGMTTPSYRASIDAGSFNTFEGQVSAVIPVGNSALSINGNVFRTNGYDVSGSGGEMDGADSRAFNAGLNNVKFGGLVLSGKLSTQVANNNFDDFDIFTGGLSDALSETQTKTQTGRLSARFSLGGFENLVNTSLTDTKQTTSGTAFDSQNTGKRIQANWAVEKSWNVHTMTLLAETEKEQFSNFGGVGAGQNQAENIRNHAFVADYRFNKNAITVSASVRADFNDRFKDSQTWRVGAGYTFEGFGGRVRVSGGTGVKNPSMIELFGFVPADFVGNPDLIPETSLGYNIGYDQKLEDWDFSADYFRSNLENEIYTIFGQFDPVTFIRLTPDTVDNRNTKSKREGLELEARGSIGDRLNVRGSATFLDAKENGTTELRRPEFLASATATWTPIDPLSFTLSAEHTGSQIDTLSRLDPVSFIFTRSRIELGAFTVVGLNIRYSLNDIVTLSLRGENLLDEDYQEVVGYASQGRGGYAGIRVNF